MELQFKTLRCHHYGSVEPVKATAGIHAGKWICRVNGPTGVQEMGTKPIYAAPYINAAKAAIAKHLHISVSEVEMLPTSKAQAPETPPTTACQSSRTIEFEDNDEDFANFDLHAAISSAKKQPATPQQQLVVKRPQNCIPTNHCPTSNSNGNHSFNKPPQYPKRTNELKSCNSEFHEDDSHVSSLNITTKIKEEQNILAELRKDVDELRQERVGLLNEICDAKKHKEQLENDSCTAREETAQLKQECMTVEKQIQKLRGTIRAVREENDSVQNDLKITTEKIRIALEEKERHERSAAVAKEELDARRAEIHSAKSNLGAEIMPTCCTEPPKKTRKTEKPTKGGIVLKSMKASDLREEALARGIDAWKMTRNDMLNLLGVGTTLMNKTDVWGEVLRVRAVFESERRQATELENERLHQMELKQEKEEHERQEMLAAAKKAERASELVSQTERHNHHFPAVHSCHLARTEDLLLHGEPRCYNAFCSECRSQNVLYTCESCDFDVCQECFKEKTMTPEEKKVEAARKAVLERQKRKRDDELRRLREEEEEKERKRWDPTTHFKPKIIHPEANNCDPNGNRMKGFTIFCSSGYGYDGWHSYEGPPNKVFDSTYTTKKEANERARYLFYWKNPWGLEPKSIMEEEEVDESMKDGLVTYVVTPPDSETWTVSVVPDAAYAFLENASSRRHGNDFYH